VERGVVLDGVSMPYSPPGENKSQALPRANHFFGALAIMEASWKTGMDFGWPVMNLPKPFGPGGPVILFEILSAAVNLLVWQDIRGCRRA